MKRYILIASLLFSTANVSAAETLKPQPEDQLHRILEQRFGDDALKKIELLDSVSRKIDRVQTAKAVKIKALIGKVRHSIVFARLPEYIVRKYLESGRYGKEDFRTSYEELRKTDPRADIYPSYLKSLTDSMQDDPLSNEDSMKFRALVYLYFSIGERVRENPRYEENIKSEWDRIWADAVKDSGTRIALSKAPIYRRILEEVAKKEHVNTYSAEDLRKMRETIRTERISPDSFYFKAYLSLREKLTDLRGGLRLPIRFTHTLQSRKLSCEANSATDLVNYYRTNGNLMTVKESDIIDSLPVESGSIVRTASSFIWSDPNRYFVGSLDGKQSSNPNNFSGYGIYADGIAPVINRFLSAQNLEVRKGAFDEKKILDSLADKHPVMFWYLSPVSENDDGAKKYSTRPIVWKTPEGKEILGYIGEHVGLLVGAEFDGSGRITSVSYFQGRNEALERRDFKETEREASFFDEALYVIKQ